MYLPTKLKRIIEGLEATVRCPKAGGGEVDIVTACLRTKEEKGPGGEVNVVNECPYFVRLDITFIECSYGEVNEDDKERKNL